MCVVFLLGLPPSVSPALLFPPALRSMCWRQLGSRAETSAPPTLFIEHKAMRVNSFFPFSSSSPLIETHLMMVMPRNIVGGVAEERGNQMKVTDSLPTPMFFLEGTRRS